MRFLSAVGFVLSLLPPVLPAADPPRKILFVGNSYTAQVSRAVSGMVAASPHREARLTFVAPGGKTLRFHADHAALLERIRSGGWDVVVLQEQSQTPALLPRQFLAASKRLHEVITASGARTAYFQTWGRRDGDRANAGLLPTYEKMQEALTKSYREAARRDGALLVPVGEAWSLARSRSPALGRQLYKPDGSHPSAKGAFLAACCFYTALFDADADAVPFDAGLPKAEAEWLRKAAADALRIPTPTGP